MGFLSMPIRGLMRVFEEVANRAEEERYNDDAVKVQLMELYKALEASAITEAEFEKREAELVERLEEIEEHKKAKAGHGSH